MLELLLSFINAISSQFFLRVDCMHNLKTTTGRFHLLLFCVSTRQKNRQMKHTFCKWGFKGLKFHWTGRQSKFITFQAFKKQLSHLCYFHLNFLQIIPPPLSLAIIHSWYPWSYNFLRAKTFNTVTKHNAKQTRQQKFLTRYTAKGLISWPSVWTKQNNR